MSTILRALQAGIESLYHLDTDVDVRDFLLENRDRDDVSPTRRPDEQLLLWQDGDALELGLFIDERLLARLAAHDFTSGAGLTDGNLNDFLLAIEGVSHFVCMSWRAKHARPISAIELELQAEIDKYLVVLLLGWKHAGEPSIGLPDRLFTGCAYAPDLDSDERSRYTHANAAALRYTGTLEARFVRPRSVDKLLVEVREFYRRGLADKLGHIQKLAA